MAVRSGRLRNRMQLWKSAGVRDSFGAITNEKERIGVFWCSIDNTKNETVGNDVRQNQNRIVIETRYNKLLETPTNDMYIVFKGNEWDIEGVINPRFVNERLLITCVLRGQ